MKNINIKRLISLYEFFGNFNLNYVSPVIELDKDYILSNNDISLLENHFNVKMIKKEIKVYNKYSHKTKNIYKFKHVDRIPRIINKCKLIGMLDDDIYYQLANKVKLTNDDKIYISSIGVNLNDYKDYNDDIPF